MFFLPAELAKEARNEILPHLTGGWDFRYRIRSCDPVFFFLEATAFPPTQPPFCQSACSHTSWSWVKRKKKKHSDFLYVGTLYFLNTHCIWVVRLQIKWHCILVWQTNGIQCARKQNVCVNGPFPEPGLVWYQHGPSDVIENKREHPTIFLLTSKTKPCDGLFTGAHLFGKHINSTFVSVYIYISVRSCCKLQFIYLKQWPHSWLLVPGLLLQRPWILGRKISYHLRYFWDNPFNFKASTKSFDLLV